MKLDQAKEILTGITNNPGSCLFSQRTAIQTVLNALAKAGILPKIPIDHSKAESDEAPFNGLRYLLHLDDGNIVTGAYITCCEPDDEYVWVDGSGYTYYLDDVTHYTPMPEFEVKGGEA